MDPCTDILNSHRCVWLRPRSALHPVPGAALGDKRVSPGHRPGWGREAKQTRSRPASPCHVHSPEQASWPQGRYCLCGEQGPRLRRALISCINCTRIGKSRGLPAPHAPRRSQPRAGPRDGFSQPFSLRPLAAAHCSCCFVAPHFQTPTGCWVSAGGTWCFELIQ